MDIRIISTIGTEEPVTLAEAKNYLRINNTQDDDLITSYITNARLRAERYLNSDIVSKQRLVYLLNIDQPINLMYAPIASIDMVTINGETQNEGEGYDIRGLDNPLIEFDTYNDAFNYRVNSYSGNVAERVEITYTTAGLDFSLIKPGVLALIAELYYGRTEPIKTNWRAFLSPFKSFGYYGTR